MNADKHRCFYDPPAATRHHANKRKQR